MSGSKVFPCSAAIALCVLAACSRSSGPAERDAAPPVPAAPPPAMPPSPPDARDAPGDAADGASSGVARPAAHKAIPASAGEGGGGGAIAGLKISGDLPRPAVSKVLRAGAGALRASYERQHATHPALRGRVTFALTTDERGRVTLGEVVKSTLGGGDPEMCMVQAARDWKFPAPPGGGESRIEFQIGFGR
jgi:hypothetical protein